MACTYKYDDKEYTYEQLLDTLMSNPTMINDLLFSRDNIQDKVFSRLIELKEQNMNKRANGKFTSQFSNQTTSNENIDNTGSAELNVPKGHYSLQSFIDSVYNDINGNPIMPILKVANFLQTKIEQLKKSMDETQAHIQAKLLTDNWNRICADARDFHKIIMKLNPSGSFQDVKNAVMDTSFEKFAEKLNPNSDDSVYSKINKQVRLTNGKVSRELGVETGCKILKNVDLSADLLGLEGKIHAHIDYIAIKPDGSLEIFLIKSSHESSNFWDRAKKEKYHHEIALLYRILQFNKLNTQNIRFNIIPAIFQYDNAYKNITDIIVEPAICYSHRKGAFILQEALNQASRYIESNISDIKISTDTINEVNKQLQAFIPEGNIKAQGVTSTIIDYIDSNWSMWIQVPQPDEGYDLNINGKIHHVSGNEVGSQNENVINLIKELRNELTLSEFTSASNLISKLKNSRNTGILKLGDSHLDEFFSKYFEHTEEMVDDKPNYKYTWKIIENDDISDCNIIMFQNNFTGQIDIISLSELSLSTKYKLNGYDNILGFHVSDMNGKDSNGHELLRATYGNIDMMRVMFLLNAIVPSLEDIKLGNISVIGGLGKKVRSQSYPVQMIIPNFIKAIQEINKVESFNINNNLINTDFISPTDLLIQDYVSIMQKNPNFEISDLGTLKDILVGRDEGTYTNIEGEVITSLAAAENTEVKILRLEELIDKLQTIITQHNYSISVESLANYDKIHNAEIKLCMKLLSEAVITLDRLYGNIRIVDDDLRSVDRTLSRPQNISNNQVRLVGKLLQDAIHTTASRMDPEISQFIQDCLEYYEQKRYGKFENFAIGSQARLFQDLYQDLDNELLFKNPYDVNSVMDPIDREFLKKVLKYINKFRFKGQNFNNKSDEEMQQFIMNHVQYLFVPLEKASTATRRLNIWKNPTQYAQDLNRRILNYCHDTKKYFQEMVEGVLTQEEIQQRDSDMEDMQAYNKFKVSEIKSGRERLLKHGKEYFETNVETLVVDYIHRYIQEEEMNRMLLKTKGILLYLKLKGQDEGDPEKFKNIVKYIDDYVSVSIYGKSVMEEDLQKWEARIRPLRKAVTKAYIAINPVGGVRDTIGGALSNIVRSLTKYMTDVNVSDVLWAYKYVLTEGSLSTMDIDILDKFNSKYLISNINIEQQQEGYKTGREGILNDNWQYSMLKRPDFLNRMVLFIAKLKHDGSIGAYYVEDGKLKYNYENDQRFNLLVSNDTSDIDAYNKQKSLYLSSIIAYNKENPNAQIPVKLTSRLPEGYTLNQIEEIKNLGNTIYGAYSNSEKSGYERMFVGHQLGAFSTWMNGIFDVYFGKRRESSYETEQVQATDDNGNLLWIDENTGNITTKITGTPYLTDIPIIVQGVFNTLIDTGKLLFFRPNKWQAFKEEILNNKVNKRNLMRGLSDLLVWLILSQLFKQVVDPAYKEHKKNADGTDIVSNAILEIMYKGSGSCFDEFRGPFPVIDYVTNNTKPAAFQWSQKFVNDTYKMMFGDKTFGEYVIGMQALPRSMQDTYKMYVRDTQMGESSEE